MPTSNFYKYNNDAHEIVWESIYMLPVSHLFYKSYNFETKFKYNKLRI